MRLLLIIGLIITTQSAYSGQFMEQIEDCSNQDICVASAIMRKLAKISANPEKINSLKRVMRNNCGNYNESSCTGRYILKAINYNNKHPKLPSTRKITFYQAKQGVGACILKVETRQNSGWKYTIFADGSLYYSRFGQSDYSYSRGGNTNGTHDLNVAMSTFHEAINRGFCN